MARRLLDDNDAWAWRDGETEVWAETARGEPVVRVTGSHGGNDVFYTPDQARALGRMLHDAADAAARLP